MCVAIVAPADGRTLVTGTGTIQETNTTRVATPVGNEVCPGEYVEFVTRKGDVAFSGVISNEPEHGQLDFRGLRNPCVDPSQTPYLLDYHLTDVTVCGRTGDLDIHVTAIGTGDVVSPDGAAAVAHFVLTGSGGQLRHATGEGIVVSKALVGSAFRTYYAEILLDGNPNGIACDEAQNERS